MKHQEPPRSGGSDEHNRANQTKPRDSLTGETEQSHPADAKHNEGDKAVIAYWNSAALQIKDKVNREAKKRDDCDRGKRADRTDRDDNDYRSIEYWNAAACYRANPTDDAARDDIGEWRYSAARRWAGRAVESARDYPPATHQNIDAGHPKHPAEIMCGGGITTGREPNRETRNVQDLRPGDRRSSAAEIARTGHRAQLHSDCGAQLPLFLCDGAGAPHAKQAPRKLRLGENIAAPPLPTAGCLLAPPFDVATSSSPSFGVLVIGDLHCTATEAGRCGNLISVMKSYASDASKNIKAVLVVGDLTDGASKSSEAQKQLTQFSKGWFEPLTAAMQGTGGRVYACLGNHDSPTKSNPRPAVIDFVADRCGSPLCYSFDIENVHFACAYLHPGHGDVTMVRNPHLAKFAVLNTAAWLWADLRAHRGRRTVVFWHFPPRFEYSDWWEKWERKLTFDVIGRFDVEVVFVGHAHMTVAYHYPDAKAKNRVRVASASGGDRFAYCRFEQRQATVSFVDHAGKESSWEEMYRT